jgi:hypothetical protein
MRDKLGVKEASGSSCGHRSRLLFKQAICTCCPPKASPPHGSESLALGLHMLRDCQARSLTRSGRHLFVAYPELDWNHAERILEHSNKLASRKEV